MKSKRITLFYRIKPVAWKRSILLSIILLALSVPGWCLEWGNVSGSADTESSEKLCWAHFVPWSMGELNAYNTWDSYPEEGNPISDVPLWGAEYLQQSGLVCGIARQIESAQYWGVDGFTVDITQIEKASNTMRGFYRAAEGTNFKISLCIDAGRTVEEMVNGLGDFIREFRDHPNSYKIDGKMLITGYAVRVPYERWLEIRKRLQEQGLDAFYVLQPSFGWDDVKRLTAILDGVDGFYDFGCNGFPGDVMTQRMKNAKEVIKTKPTGILMAGIAQGYLRTTRGMYRPFLNTGSLRDSWNAALAVDADQVCLTTWNDFIEHTQFCPTAVNRSALLRINREFLTQWRHETVKPRFAEYIVSYHEAILYGDDLTLEVLALSHSLGEAAVNIRFLNEDGSVFREFKKIETNREKLDAVTLRVTDEELQDIKLLRVQAAVTRLPGDEPVYLELCPIVRRLGVTRNPRIVRQPLSELSNRLIDLEMTPLNLAEKESLPKDKNISSSNRTEQNLLARIRLKAWSASGKIELLRNGYPVTAIDVQHQGAPEKIYEIPITTQQRTGRDVWFARFTDLSDFCSFSRPVTFTAPNPTTSSKQPFIVTGSDFDENWPLWNRGITRIERPFVLTREFEEYDLFFTEFRFDQKVGNVCMADSGWYLPMSFSGGAQESHFEQAVDAWGMERGMLRFDGDDYGQMPAFCFPSGAFTMEFLIKREATPPGKNGQGLLIDGSGTSLRIDEKDCLVFSRKDRTLVTTAPVPCDTWCHIAAVHDLAARQLILYLDGQEIGRAASSYHKTTCNSGPRIGNDWKNNGFCGLLGGFRLESAVRVPEEFKLLPSK